MDRDPVFSTACFTPLIAVTTEEGVHLAVASPTMLERDAMESWVAGGHAVAQGWRGVGGEAKGGISKVGWVRQN